MWMILAILYCFVETLLCMTVSSHYIIRDIYCGGGESFLSYTDTEKCMDICSQLSNLELNCISNVIGTVYTKRRQR